MQHAREEKLVVMLGALLRRYVEGDAQGFEVSRPWTGGLSRGRDVGQGACRCKCLMS